MSLHPRPDVFEGVLRRLSSEAAGVVLHLLHCEPCRIEAQALLAPAEQLEGVLVLAAGLGPEIDCGRIWQRLAARDLTPELARALEEALELQRKFNLPVP